MKLFAHRCVDCRRPASDIHELEPRSRGSRAFAKGNQVAICRRCHDKFHSLGASPENIARLRQKAYNFLTAMGKPEAQWYASISGKNSPTEIQ